MAWDKVTKIDSIAKRKPYTREHQGMLCEYNGIGKRMVVRAAEQPIRKLILTNKQRRAKNAQLLGQRIGVNETCKRFVGDAGYKLATSWPTSQRVNYGAGDARK